MNPISVIISSCDKYSFAWPIIKHAFQKYWPDCTYPIYFITNKKEAPFGKTIKTGLDQGWSNQMIKALTQINTEFLIFLLEDYWFNDQVNIEELNQLYHIMKGRPEISHIRLYVSAESSKIHRKSYCNGLNILNPNEDYRASFNAGIWRKNTLINLLEPNKSIWDSEHSMTDKSRNKLFLTVTEMKYIKYNIDHNMVERGQFTDHARKYMEQESINIS